MNILLLMKGSLLTDWYSSVSSRPERWTQSESSNLAEYLCPIPCSTDPFPWYSPPCIAWPLSGVPWTQMLQVWTLLSRLSRGWKTVLRERDQRYHPLLCVWGTNVHALHKFICSTSGLLKLHGGVLCLGRGFVSTQNSYAEIQTSKSDGSQRWDLWEVNRSWGQSPQEWD